MKVVLDTNALLSAIPSRSKFNVIIDFLNAGVFTLLVSTEIYFEYIEILERRGNPMAVGLLESAILKEENIEVIDPSFFWNLITEDPNDNKFVDCAITGNADYLVTNDAHFNNLKNLKFPTVNVITIEEFLSILIKQL